MKIKYKKGISTPLVLSIILILCVLVIGYLSLGYFTSTSPSENSPIIFANISSVDQFILDNDVISPKNIDFVKEVTEYETKISAFGVKYTYINYVKYGDNIYFVDERKADFNNIKADVYSLNLKTNELKQVYKSNLSQYYYNLIGIQDKSLLFVKMSFEDSPGPCFNPWFDAVSPNSQRKIVRLSLNDPSGFVDTVPKLSDVQIQNLNSEREKCTNSL